MIISMSDFNLCPCSQPKYGEQILILLVNDFNDPDFFYPYYRFIEEGYTPTIVGITKTEINDKYTQNITVEKYIDDINPDDFDLIFIPGRSDIEPLRKNENLLNLIRAFHNKHKLIISICHGPQLLLDAGIIKGINITCWPKLQDVFIQQGAIFYNEPVVRDHCIITSRYSADLPYLMQLTLYLLKFRF